MCFERFKAYILGTCFENTGKRHTGCTDKTLPAECRPVLIPYQLYFGNESHSWQGGGVAFLDSNRPGVVLGRMYLITTEQFRQIMEQECTLPFWYNRELLLGSVDGYPVKTFTNSGRRPENSPSPEYLSVLRRGMMENVDKLKMPE